MKDNRTVFKHCHERNEKLQAQYDEKYEERDCPRCGKPMFCTGDMNCWCLSIEIPGKVEDYIAATFDGCLCKDCLMELIGQFENTR